MHLGEAVERRHYEPPSRMPDQAMPEDRPKLLFERRALISIVGNITIQVVCFLASGNDLHPRVVARRENLFPVVEVEAENVARLHTDPKGQGDYTSRRGPGDHVEVVASRATAGEPLLAFRKYGSREDTFDPSTVDRQDGKSVGLPAKLFAWLK